MPERKKVMILGGDGMFARDLASVLQNSEAFDAVPLSRKQLDITDKNTLRERIQDLKPYAVVNTVGPLVDICEEDPEFAQLINVTAVRSCAVTCGEIGAKFVHLSTCGLFGDEKKYYTEADSVVLKTEYARTKYEGEQASREANEDTIVVRPGWMYGGSPNLKKNFVAARIREAKGKPLVGSAMDKFGSPTWTHDAADAVVGLLQSEDASGVYNMCCTGGGSRAEYVREILTAAGLETVVEDVDSSAFPRKAQVPDCEMLDNARLERAIGRPMKGWKDALRTYIESLPDLEV
jgi:dTDP-4-dehydrorhamnose reductase